MELACGDFIPLDGVRFGEEGAHVFDKRLARLRPVTLFYVNKRSLVMEFDPIERSNCLLELAACIRAEHERRLRR